MLEGLLAYERAGGSQQIAEARRRGEEYLLERSLFRRKSTGEVAVPGYLQFSFPPHWHYDVLRGLEYFRAAPGGRRTSASTRRSTWCEQAQPDGTWLLENTHRGAPLPAGGRRRDAEPVEHAARLRVLRWDEDSPR